MGLKRRHKHKNQQQKFDPKRLVKLDHKRKCYVVDEAPRYPLIATPRNLRKRFHYFSESENDTDSDDRSTDNESHLEEFLIGDQAQHKDLIRMSACSNDSGFEGGGTAPADPTKMLGKLELKKMIV